MTDQEPRVIRTISILGGTGKEGQGLAYRWLKAGYRIIIGSRSEEKACRAAEDLRELLGKDVPVTGMTNDRAAQAGDLLVLTVPYSAHAAMCEAIKPFAQGKALIDVTVPLVSGKVTKVHIPEAGSAAMEAKAILGEDVEVLSAFQNISYERLLQEGDVGCDVLVSGGKKGTRRRVVDLIREAGMVGWDAGPIENSVVAESLTSILIGLNKQFGTHTAGIRIVGVPRPDGLESE